MSIEREPLRLVEGGSDAPDELRRWLRASRDGLGTPDQVAELARGLAEALGPQAGLAMPQAAPIAAPIAAGRTSWAAAWLAGGLVLGGAVWALFPRPTPLSTPPEPGPLRDEAAASVPPRAPAPAPSADAPSVAPPAATVAPEPPAAEQGAREPASKSARPSRAARPTARPKRSEAALLERARAALETNPERALALTREHRRSFADGALVQEREVIAIEALERLGRDRAASQRAREFEARYGDSLHKSRLEAGSGSTPAKKPEPKP